MWTTNKYRALFAEPETYDFEIEIDGEIKKGQITAIPLMAQNEFATLVQQLAIDKRPCRLKFSKPQQIWSQFDQTFKQIENCLEFFNNAWEG